MNRYPIILAVFLMGPNTNSVGQTHVQTVTLFQTTTATTISKAFGAASTSGNLIVVHLDWDGQTRSISSVTDNKGNSYAKINGPTNWNGPNYRAELWYAYNITGGGAAITVTGHLSGAPTSFSQIYITEYSGIISAVNPLDQNSVATGNTLAVSSGSKTTTYNNELIYGASIGASGTLSKGASFTSRSTANSNIIEDKNAVAVGSYDANFTSAGGNWIAQMVTFITTSSTIILPVDLLTFTGKCDSAGNSSTIQNYSFTADQTNDEISYFRLKQTDKDGKFEYYNTIPVDHCNKDISSIIIYPNPTDGLTLSGRINDNINESYSIVIFDKLGMMVGRFSSDKPEFRVYFPHMLTPGIYYTRFYSAKFSRTASFLVKH